MTVSCEGGGDDCQWERSTEQSNAGRRDRDPEGQEGVPEAEAGKGTLQRLPRRKKRCGLEMQV